MAKKKPTAHERQARAAANGYQRGAHREKDSVKDENKYVEVTEELQDWALILYKEWMAADGDDEGECLARGAQAPDLATVKDFIRFYIKTSKGRISLNPVRSSVLNFAERFFGGFKRLTNTEINAQDRSDVFHWIRNTLVKNGTIEHIERPKHNFVKQNLIDLLNSIWAMDDPKYIHERYRIQLTFAILSFCFSGARIGAFIPKPSQKDRGIRYKDIEIFLQRVPDGWLVNYRLDQRFVKNNRDPKFVKFGIPFTENKILRFNAALFLLALAFADDVLFGYNSPADLWEQEIISGEDEVVLRWKEEALEKPVMRMISANGCVSEEAPFNSVVFCELLRLALENSGFFGRITVHSIRRGLANKVDKTATEAERSQLLNQRDPNIYGQDYIANVTAVNAMAAYLDEPAETRHIEYLQGAGRYQERGLPIVLPAEIEDSISHNPELVELERKAQQLKLSGADKSKISDVKSELRLRRKQIRDEALRQYQQDWVRKRRDWKILSRGKELPKDPAKTDIIGDIFRVMPERARIAEMWKSTKALSKKEKLRVVEDLLSLCKRDLQVIYRPGEEPINGKCPIEGCGKHMQSLKKPQRSSHIHGCRRRELAARLGRKEHELIYCFLCFEWFNDEQKWETHCRNHLTSMESFRCEITTYRHTLIRAGYCTFCLHDAGLLASSRMRQWTRSTELWDHMEEIHINDRTWPSPCPDDRCETLDSAASCRYHLSDFHGFRRYVSNRRGNRDYLKEDEAEDDLKDEIKTAQKRKRSNISQGQSKRRLESLDEKKQVGMDSIRFIESHSSQFDDLQSKSAGPHPTLAFKTVSMPPRSTSVMSDESSWSLPSLDLYVSNAASETEISGNKDTIDEDKIDPRLRWQSTDSVPDHPTGLYGYTTPKEYSTSEIVDLTLSD